MKNDYEIQGDTTVIFLNRKGKSHLEMLIDTSDLEWAKSFEGTWRSSYSRDTSSYYCSYTKSAGVSAHFHTKLMSPPENMVVDHINHNTLDNRRANLRVVSRKANQINRRGANRNNRTSGIRGVSWHKGGKSWMVCICDKYLGLYKTLEEAAEVARQAQEETLRAALYPSR